MNTPAFVVWALEHCCTLRDVRGWRDPEQTERQLRPLRAIARAGREGRIWEGVAVAHPLADGAADQLGFRVAEVLQAYGGKEEVDEECGDCWANVATGAPPKWAGCFGEWPLVAGEEATAEQFERALDEAELADRFDELFPHTTPRWYGAWIEGSLTAEQAGVLKQAIDGIGTTTAPTKGQGATAGSSSSARTQTNSTAGQASSGTQSFELSPHLERRRLSAALEIAASQGRGLHVSLKPPGEVIDSSWRTAPHCGRCTAPRESADGVCSVCGSEDHWRPAKTRKAKGDRPYIPLSRFMGEEGAEEWLAMYASLPTNAGPPVCAHNETVLSDLLGGDDDDDHS